MSTKVDLTGVRCTFYGTWLREGDRAGPGQWNLTPSAWLRALLRLDAGFGVLRLLGGGTVNPTLAQRTRKDGAPGASSGLDDCSVVPPKPRPISRRLLSTSASGILQSTRHCKTRACRFRESRASSTPNSPSISVFLRTSCSVDFG